VVEATVAKAILGLNHDETSVVPFLKPDSTSTIPGTDFPNWDNLFFIDFRILME